MQDIEGQRKDAGLSDQMSLADVGDPRIIRILLLKDSFLRSLLLSCYLPSADSVSISTLSLFVWLQRWLTTRVPRITLPCNELRTLLEASFDMTWTIKTDLLDYS